MKAMRKICSVIVILAMLVGFLPAGVQLASAANLPGTQVDLSTLNSTYTISDNGTYSFTGSGSYGITVTGGSPTIVLSDATINVSSGPAINITGGSPTIKVEGNNTVQCSGSSYGTDGAGIYVAQGSSVTITADDRSSSLTARAGRNGAGIGSYNYGSTTTISCGNITITNVTVYAYPAASSDNSPGIGAYGESGTITIDNATVYAYGAATVFNSSPAIGSFTSSVPIINILHGSTIYAYRGAYNGTSYADYIGQGGTNTGYAGGQIQTGTGGSITNSTIHTGDYSNNTPSSTTEHPYNNEDSTPFPIEITATTGATAAEGYATGPTLSVTATGSGLSYQWYKDSVSYANQIDGETGHTYQVETGLGVGTYTYKCVVKSGNYTLASDPITFTVKNSQSTPPAAPSSASKVSTNSVTLTAVTSSGQGAVQYGYTTSGGSASDINNWQTDTEFTGLSAGTDYTFYTRFEGNDSYAPSDPSATGLTVTTLPDITTTNLDAGTVGVYYSQTLQAGVETGKTVTWVLASGSTLPAGLTLNNDGTITGTPRATATSHSFTVQATISGGADGAQQVSNTATLTITINQGTPTITITSGSGTYAYGDTITITGNIVPSSTLPAASNGINAITEPAQNQVALFLGDKQLTDPVAVESDNTFSITYDTAGQQIPTGSQTLTVRYGGSSALTSGETNVTITLNKKSVTAQVQGDITKVYDGDTDVDVSLAVASSDLVNNTDNITVTGTGTYENASAGTDIPVTVSITETGGTDKDWYAVSAPSDITGSITSATASVDTAPTAETELTYTGMAQALVTAGTASGGTMVYALGDEAAATGEYSSTIPTVTDAGTYYVWYKVQGDSNHNDTEPQYVTVTISQVTLTVSATASDKTYDGTTAATGTIALTGAVNGEQPTATGTFAFADANAGENKTVSVTDIALEDTWRTNYALNTTSVTTTATITKATPALTLSADRDTLSGGGRVVLTLSGLPEGESATVTGNNGITVTASGDNTWIASLPNRTATYTFTATTSGSGNYNAATATTTVSVQSYMPPSQPTTPSEPEKPSGPSTGDSDGWTSITDELDKLNPDTQEEPLTIEMNGETEVPKEVFETIAGKDVDVVFDMGDGVSWSVNGADIPADADLSNLDLGVSMNTDGIPVDVINAITGEATSVQITLAHDGDFGFALTLSAPLGEENAGYWANLYHYNEDAEAMDFETAALIDDDGTANLRMTHASQYAIVIDDHSHAPVETTPVSDIFTDVAPDVWYIDAVQYAYDQGLMTGTSATTFEPNTATTRGMIVSILYRLEGNPNISDENLGYPFADVDASAWYADPVYWARMNGIVAGFEDGTFRPNAPITREQMAAILYNYAQWKGMDVSARADLSRYSDQPSVWAEEVMQWAVGEGLISGTTVTTLDPQGTATRAQVAAIFERFLSE